MGNINFTAGKNLKKIRTDLGLKQWELECEGAQNLSHLENGVKAITEDVSAPVLLKKIQEIMKERNLTLPGYQVTLDILLGKENIITNDIIKNLKKEKIVSEKNVCDIDNSLRELSEEDSIIFLELVIDDLIKKGIIENTNLIKKYTQQLLRFNLNQEQEMKANRDLIRAYTGLHAYDDIIYTAELIEEKLERCKDKDVKVSCYKNIAVAYHKRDNFDKTIEFYKKLRSMGKCSEFFYLTLKAARLLKMKDFQKAEKEYLNIANKATAQGDSDYEVDGYSNLADVYYEMDLKNESKDNIDKSLNNIKVSTSRTFRFNAYFNAFNIYNKYCSENIEKIEEFFLQALPLAIELRAIDKLNLLIKDIFSIYIKINKIDNIYEILKVVRGTNIDQEILFDVIENMRRKGI